MIERFRWWGHRFYRKLHEHLNTWLLGNRISPIYTIHVCKPQSIKSKRDRSMAFHRNRKNRSHFNMMNWSVYHHNFTYAIVQYIRCSCVEFSDALHQIDFFLAFKKFAHFNEKMKIPSKGFAQFRETKETWLNRLKKSHMYLQWMVFHVEIFVSGKSVCLIKLNRNDTVMSFFFSFENGKPSTIPLHTQQLMQHVYDKVYVCFLIIEIWSAHQRVFKFVWVRVRKLLFFGAWHYTRE